VSVVLKLKLIASVVSAIFCLALIVWANYIQIADWFGKNGPANLGSIEVSYVSMGRFLVDFGFRSFAPFWYFGFPFHLFYTPLLPFLEALINKLFGIPLWESYRLLTGLGFIAAPISVFFLGWQLSKRVIGGLVAAIFFSVGPTIFYYLDPGVAQDKFSADFWDPRRFTILVRWGEGPHIFSLIFVPLVGLFYSKLLEDRRFRWLVLSSIFLGLAGLTNAIGLFSSILLVLVMSSVKFAQILGQAENDKKQPIFLGIFVGLMALGLISFWYNLSFIANFFGEGEAAGNIYLSLFPWGWVGGGAILVFIYLLFRKVIKDFAVGAALLWFVVFFVVVHTYYLTGTELLPQALRYNVEVDMSLSIFIGVLFAWLVGFIGKKLRLLEIAGNAVGVLGVLGLVWYIQPFISTASKAAGTITDIKNTGEYEISSWLKNHVDEKKGERVFVPGNYGFYLNYFTNIWQHRGGLFQAATHEWPDHIYYQLANGTDSEIARAWLVASNSNYLVVSPREMYHDIKNTQRFSDFPIVYENEGDIVYKVPLKRESVAKVVDLSRMGSLVVPKKGDDKKAILAYADWVESAKPGTVQYLAKQNSYTEFSVINNDTYKITGEVGEREGILVQMTEDSGWNALRQAQGKLESVKTGKDPLGFLVLYPQAGEVDITLKHGRIWQEWLVYLLTIGTIGFVIWYGIVGRKKYSVFSKGSCGFGVR
jgi:hypothetical protein